MPISCPRRMTALFFAALLVLSGCGQDLTAAEHVSKAKDYMDKGELKPALIELSSAVQKDPGSVEGRWLLAKVAAGMGLVDAALQVAENNTAAVQAWLADGRLAKAELADAEDWHARKPMFWAVVVAPWVLVQEVLPELTN